MIVPPRCDCGAEASLRVQTHAGPRDMCIPCYARMDVADRPRRIADNALVNEIRAEVERRKRRG